MTDSDPRERSSGQDEQQLHLGEPTEVAPGIFTLVAEPASVTIGIIAGRDGALVVDTGSAPAQGAAIRELATQLSGVPVTAAVVTHGHFDHAFGLAAFTDLTTIGHASLSETITASEAAGPVAAEYGFAVADLAVPNRPIVVATALDLGGRRVEIAHLGRGHTEGDLMVVVSDADLVFTGDLIESATPPFFGTDSVPMEWAATLDGLIGLLTGDSRAVPGHGPIVDREFVFEQRGQIAAVAGELARVRSLGLSLEEALDQGQWPFPPEHIRYALEVALAQPRPAGERRNLPLL